MAIEEIDLDAPEAEISAQLARLIETCSRGWELFFAENEDDEAPGFVPSIPEIVFDVLTEVTKQNLPRNRIFCEWGSGFGVVTCMAALLGYKAYGIEIEEELVRQSRAIARRLKIPVEIICTNLFPDGYGSHSGVDGIKLLTPESLSDGAGANRCLLRYDGMDIDVAEVGLFFVYSWPSERELMLNLFDSIAAEGTILVAYYTDRKVSVFRKVAV